MFCPKCGQVTINLNNKEVCTNCGIVFDDLNAKEQVLSQIRAKAQVKTAPEEPVEEYISPAGLVTKAEPMPKPRAYEHTEKNIQASGTIEEMARRMHTPPIKIAPPVAQAAVEIAPAESSVQKVIPQEQPAFKNPSAMMPPSAPSPAVQTSSKSSAELQINTEENEQPNAPRIYPSHEVNPILIKMLIGIFVIALLVLGGMFLYSHLTFLRDTVNNIIKGVGVNLFK